MVDRFPMKGFRPGHEPTAKPPTLEARGPEAAAGTVWGVANEDKNVVRLVLFDKDMKIFAQVIGTRHEWDLRFAAYENLKKDHPLVLT